MSKYVEKKFIKIKLLLQFLTLLKKLCEEFNCKDDFGFNGYELQKRIYIQIANQAERG